MNLVNIFEKLKTQFFSKWVACRLIPDKKSVQYGIYFSYPFYILIVIVGILLQNVFILGGAALIALLAIKLPLHPFDYVYNQIAKFIGTNKIPGRGSELQVNSTVALIFNLIAVALITFNISINFSVLAIIYGLSSAFFIGIFLFKD